MDAAITSNIDVAQLALYAFWIFFFGLILYLRREDKREGYPLESERSRRAPRVQVVGFPPPPPPKTFRLPHGEGVREAPRVEPPPRPIEGTTSLPFPGEPLRPTGDPMREAIGPASYADREDVADLTFEGNPKVVPMRVAPEFWVPDEDPDPRGMTVVGADNRTAGTVRELWVDRAEPRILFFEVELAEPYAPANDPETDNASSDRVLLPVGFARVDARRRRIRVVSIRAHQFAHVPRPQSSEQITRREEDKITGYFGSGHLYAYPSRQEPLV